MKIKHFFIAAAGAAMLFTSCGGPGEGKDISDLKSPTMSDSLSNYFGQMYAYDFWRNNYDDSTKISDEARAQYLKGAADALKMSGKDYSYIEGYILGLSLLQYQSEFTGLYGVDLNRDILLDGLAYGLRNDSAVNIKTVQDDVNRLTTVLQLKRDKADQAAATKNLSEFAKKRGYKSLGKDLFGTINNPGSGAALKDGDNVDCDLQVTDTNGKSIGMPMPKTITVGQQMRNLPIGSALQLLKPGGSGEFATSAYAIFGARAQQYGLKPDQTLVFTLNVKGVSAPTKGVGKGQPTDTVAAN